MPANATFGKKMPLLDIMWPPRGRDYPASRGPGSPVECRFHSMSVPWAGNDGVTPVSKSTALKRGRDGGH